MKLSLETLRKAKEKVKEIYLNKNLNVNGIGIGDGFIKIMLVEQTEEKFPEEVDGVPLKVVVVGKIDAY